MKPLPEDLVTNLRQVIDSFIQFSNDESSPIDVQIMPVVKSIRLVLEDGLEGTSTVKPFIWSVVRRLANTSPEIFKDSLEGVRSLAKRCRLDRKRKEEVWIRQALEDGGISALLDKIPTEADVKNSYSSNAIVIDQDKRSKVLIALNKLKGLTHSVSSPRPHSLSLTESSNETKDSSILDSEATTSQELSHPSDFKTGKRQEEGIKTESTSELSTPMTGRSLRTRSYKGSMKRSKSKKDHQERRNISEKEMAPSREAQSTTASTSFRRNTGEGHNCKLNIPRHESIQDKYNEIDLDGFSSQQRQQISKTSQRKPSISVSKSTNFKLEDRTAAALMLLKELEDISQVVVDQYCMTHHALSLRSDLVVKLCSLYEEAFAFGMRPCPIFPPSESVKYLSEIEDILTDGKTSSFALLYSLERFSKVQDLGIEEYKSQALTEEKKFQKWIHTSLLSQCFGKRVESILLCPDFLQGWYYARALIMDEHLSQRFLASCYAMEGIRLIQEKATMDEDARKLSTSVNYSCSNMEFDVDNTKEGTEAKVHERQPKCTVGKSGGSQLDVSTEQNTTTSFSHSQQLICSTDFLIQHGSTVTPFASSDFNNLNTDGQPGEYKTEEEQRVGTTRQRLLTDNTLHNIKIPLVQGHESRSIYSRSSPTQKVMSQTTEEEEKWSGVWKDVDVIKYEVYGQSKNEQYAVYVIEVLASDGTQWQTARRFSQVEALRKTLRKKRISLPHSWSNLFGARSVHGKARFTYDVLESRLALIRQCLWDLKVAFPESLSWQPVSEFLDAPMSILRGTKSRQRQMITPSDVVVQGKFSERFKRLVEEGMILIVDLPTSISDEVLFEIQQGRCPGCYGYLPGICHHKPIFKGSPSPRKCEYTELLYCHNCHHMENAILPYKVLHEWDFRKFTVSNKAKKYILSTFLHPALCINTVNPGLLASVPVLGHLQYMRYDIIEKLKVLRNMGVKGKRLVEEFEGKAGSNIHLLQNADYWSLKDFGDISRGVFATLPRWLEIAHSTITKLVIS